MIRCGSCGEENPPRARFCLACAAPLIPTDVGAESRRFVTVLFADLVSSTTIGERLDPEAFRAIQARYFAALREVIERHGGTVQGSSRAERHLWTVNLTTRAATCKRIGHRQLRPMAKKLDVRPVAEAIVQLILAGAPDERLKWNVAGDVRVQIGKILPAESAATQTVTARRKRLRTAIDELLEEAGWQKLRENVFRPPGTT